MNYPTEQPLDCLLSPGQKELGGFEVSWQALERLAKTKSGCPLLETILNEAYFFQQVKPIFGSQTRSLLRDSKHT